MNFLEVLEGLKAQYDKEIEWGQWPGWNNLEDRLGLVRNVSAKWRLEGGGFYASTLRHMNEVSSGYFAKHLDDYWYYSASAFDSKALREAIASRGFKTVSAFFMKLTEDKGIVYTRPAVYYWLSGKGKPNIETVKRIHDILEMAYGGLMNYGE
jgi:hypothetical protein